MYYSVRSPHAFGPRGATWEERGVSSKFMNINELVNQSGAEERDGYSGEGSVTEFTTSGSGQDGAAHSL